MLINNAGINIIKEFGDVDEADYDRLMDINLKAPYFLSKAAAKVMKAQKKGSILNIASIWSVISKAQRSLYTSSKSGLAGMTRSLAAELAPFGISVNSLSPGFILTDLTQESLSEKERTDLANEVPMGRFGSPEEMANLAYFLCSNENSFMTGQNIVSDGGFTLV